MTSCVRYTLNALLAAALAGCAAGGDPFQLATDAADVARSDGSDVRIVPIDAGRDATGCDPDQQGSCGADAGREASADVAMDVVATNELAGVEQISSGWYYACAVTTDGSVFCWGKQYQSATAAGTHATRVAGISDAIQVATYLNYTCVVRRTGALTCWGQMPIRLGPDFFPMNPIDVPGVADAVFVAVDNGFMCYVSRTGGVRCAGNGGYGELGNGHIDDATSGSFVDVVGVTGATRVALGRYHGCALQSDGAVQCWGGQQFGQLGDGVDGAGAIRYRATAAAVPGISDARAIAAAYTHTCIVRASGQVLCWGQNSNNQLGSGTGDVASPTAIAGIDDAVALTAADEHTCAVRRSHGVVCWGADGFGELGDGTMADSRALPVPVAGLGPALSASVGIFYSCAIETIETTSGRVRCWGRNESSQLGDDTLTDRLAPVAVRTGP